jgi:ABC-type sugar transport system ATPase subunit
MTAHDATVASDPQQPPALEMLGISKSFPGVRALTDVDLRVLPGRVHAIVGENGAGKSTLMKILAGVHQPDTGTLTVGGHDVVIGSPIDAQRIGIGMVYQELNLVPDLNVAENICLGRMPRRLGLLDRAAMQRTATTALADLDAQVHWSTRVGDLTVSQQQLVEICKVYSARPEIVVLDEPTSSLSEHESQVLFDVVRRMRDRGISVIYISHRLREVLDIADDVTVLRDGHRIESRPVEGLTPADMIRLMVGRDLTEVFPKRHVELGETVLEVRGLRRDGVFADIDLDVRRGEIVGLAGLVGSGRTEVARALFGLDRADAGVVVVDGEPVDVRRPGHAVAAGIAYVPEDRKADGIVPALSVRDNLSLASLRRRSSAGVVNGRGETALAVEHIASLGVSPAAPERRIDTLSGGNQQKVVLGKWLATEPNVLILDEPTRGVDVGAKADIHRIIGDLAASGVGILLISSELPEVLAVSDRVLVLHEGRVTAELAAADATEAAVMHAATGQEAA